MRERKSKNENEIKTEKYERNNEYEGDRKENTILKGKN